ncbi:MAG: FlaD/FlaE family flagellar protein [Halodesulfurarchaeum sp.]
MPLDPRDYDPDELRGTASDDLDAPQAGDLRERIADQETGTDLSRVIQSNQVKELLLLESGASPEELERPYLDSLPEAYAARVTLFEWLDFLLTQGGVKHTLEAMEYYAEMGWMSESVAEKLRDHVRAFDADPEGRTPAGLTVEDHVLSLVYVARLSTMD